MVSNDNGESNVTGTRIVLPIASLQPEGLEVGHEKRVARKSVAIVNRSMKILKVMSHLEFRIIAILV